MNAKNANSLKDYFLWLNESAENATPEFDLDLSFLSQRELNTLGVFLYSLYIDTPAEIGVENPNVQFEDFTVQEVQDMIGDIALEDPEIYDTVADFLSDPLDTEEILDNIDYDIETGSYSEFDAEEYIDNYNYALELASQAMSDEPAEVCESPSVLIKAVDRAERRKKKVYGQKFVGQGKGKIKNMAMMRAFRKRNKAKRIATGAFKKQKQYRTRFAAKLQKRSKAVNALKAKGQWTTLHHKGFKK